MMTADALLQAVQAASSFMTMIFVVIIATKQK